MSQENKVEKLNRIEYIEPNNLFVQSTGNKIQNGVPQPYEDYSFSVNLRVVNGDRFGCGMTAEGNDISKDAIEFSSDNGTLSFMDGTSAGGQGYLTTNFTDISMNDPSTNTKECLGIESISVRYDSWYYPTVDIRFIDVRGASLMQPSEYEYYNTGNPIKKAYRKSNSDFFKAFFSFPYPLFKLSIKGFYGKEVTYDLSVLKCNIEFNSSTGNFEVNASFIGYMYGMYSDLPFPFAYVAPYIDLYGKNTWDEKIKSKDFCYLTESKENPIGHDMYTFPELKREVENAGQAADKEIEASSGGTKRSELEALIKQLGQEVLPSCPTTSGKETKTSWWYWSKNNTEKDTSGYFFVSMDATPETNRKIFNDFLKFSKQIQEYNKLASETKEVEGETILSKEIFNDFLKDSKTILDNKNGPSGASAATISSEFTDEDISKVLDGKIVSLAFHKDDRNKEKPVLIFDLAKSDFGNWINSLKQSDYTDLINELLRRFNEDQVNSPMQKSMAQKEWTIRAFITNDIYYKNRITDVLTKLKKELADLTKELDRFRNLRIEAAIGFKPTMRNIYNMVFAHVDTFMSTFYTTLDRIRTSIQSSTDNTRKFEVLCGGDIQCDVNENALKSESPNGGKLPPFTMFFKEESEKDGKGKKTTMIWPGKLNGGKELEEVKLVESIINATALNKKSFEPVTADYNEITREGDLAPISYYDIIRGDGNPYLDILNEKSLSDENVVHDMLRVFVLRCYYAMLGGSYVAPQEGSNNDGRSTETANFTKKAKLIADLEVGNIERAFKMLKMRPTKAFLLGLNKLSTNGSELMSEYTSGKKPMFTSNAGNGDLKYTWLAKVKDEEELYRFLPVGIFDNQTLTNIAAGANLKENSDKFLKINSAETIVNRDTCHIYSGGRKIENAIGKYTSGDFSNATKLFPNYDSTPQSITGLSYFDDAVKANILPPVPSYRKTEAGDTSIFMDPLYYSQTSREARAYLFLMGIPFDNKKKFFLPEMVENGDYPTLLLLREGAYYWRNFWVYTDETDGVAGVTIENDPITYQYEINGSVIDVLGDIEKNDPCLGQKKALEFFSPAPKYVSESRKQALMDYFLKWVDGIAPDQDNPDVKYPPMATATSYVNIEVPAPSMSFPEIESNLALWELNTYKKEDKSEVTVKQLLTSASCASAITVEYASTFANIPPLEKYYIVDQDDRLGYLNGKIRTDVIILDFGDTSTGEKEIDLATKSAYEKSAKDIGVSVDSSIDLVEKNDTASFIERFKKFYFGKDTIIDFACFDKPSEKFTVPRTAMNDATAAFISGLKEANKISINYYKEHTGADSAGAPEDKSSMPEYFKSDDLKLACYMALKNMYDKWLCNRRRECWNFSCIPDRMKTGGVESDFLRFFYIDEFYHEIGMKVKPNLTNTINKICDLGGFTEKTKEENLAASSIMKVLSFTAQYAGCGLLTLPTMLGLAKTYTSDRNSIEDVFRAHPYNEAVRSNDIKSSFVVLYSNQKSSILDIKSDSGKMAYKTDGFDIADTWGNIIPQVMFCDDDEDSFVVPSFGVTFAKQNQSYFKDVKLSMQDHQVTDFSIRNELMISYQSNRGPRETAIIGQDLYGVYSNYSYSCSVTMMGDAQITPLMYFQLNNIAMWKGAYLITNVQHNITARGMETVFTGVRQSKYSVPYKNDDMEMPASDAAGQTPYSQEETQPAPTVKEEEMNLSKRPLDLINVDDVKSVVFVLDRTTLATGQFWVGGILSVRVDYNDGTKKEYNNIAKTIETVNDTYRAEKMGTADGMVENFDLEQYLKDKKYTTCIPAGRYTNVFVQDPLIGEEYRSPKDSFYAFTEGKHIIIGDGELGLLYCELITGDKNYDVYTTADDFSEISLGGTSPIMIYPPTNSCNENGIRALYKEIFGLIKRMNEVKKPLSFLITEKANILDFSQDELLDCLS